MLFFYLLSFSFQPFSLLENLLTFNSSNSRRFTVNYYRTKKKGAILLAKKKRNLSTVEKITRVVAVLMLIGTLGAIILQVALTALNYK